MTTVKTNPQLFPDVLFLLTHVSVRARNMVVEIDHPSCGPMELINSPVKYSRSQPNIRKAPPLLGQHTDEILREGLDLDDATIALLRKEKIIR